MQIAPYLFFAGRCEEALAFYARTLDARVEMIMRFGESPDPPPPGTLAAGWEDKVMHASLRIGDATVMVSDGCSPEDAGFKGFALSLDPADQAGARRVFEGLAEGGSVQMPLGATFWSPCFGMVTDRFGVGWMINVAAPG